MNEITLDAAESYFIAHVGALNNQLANGDPFVFLCGVSILSTLSKHSGLEFSALLPAHAKYAQRLERASYWFFTAFTMSYSLALTHRNELHNNPNGDGGYVIAAEPLINDVRIAVLTLFSRAKTDKVLSAKLYASLNETPFIRG